MEKLTKSQRKLVEDNHNFIYYFLRRHNLSIEEWYDTCAIGICRAAMKFQPEKGFQFLTFAGACLLNEIRQAMRKQKRKGRDTECYSLDQAVSETEDFTLADTLASPENLEDMALQKIQFRQGFDSLSERERTIFMMSVGSGMPQRVVAEHFGVSQVWVSRVLTRVKKKLLKEISM